MPRYLHFFLAGGTQFVSTVLRCWFVFQQLFSAIRKQESSPAAIGIVNLKMSLSAREHAIFDQKIWDDSALETWHSNCACAFVIARSHAHEHQYRRVPMQSSSGYLMYSALLRWSLSVTADSSQSAFDIKRTEPFCSDQGNNFVLEWRASSWAVFGRVVAACPPLTYHYPYRLKVIGWKCDALQRAKLHRYPHISTLNLKYTAHHCHTGVGYDGPPRPILKKWASPLRVPCPVTCTRYDKFLNLPLDTFR